MVRFDLDQSAGVHFAIQIAFPVRESLGGTMPLNPLKYLDRRIPRYTSYPTALQFGSDVDAGSYERWLTDLSPKAPVSIYLHVPFCAELCLYCGCHTTVARRYAPIAAYAELLEREIALVGKRLARQTVTQIHWGGGTPTMLLPQDMMRVMTALRANFTITPTTEIAIEIDPRSLTREHISAMAEIGVTRASLGVQDFEKRVQQAIRRLQSYEQTARAADGLRDAGIASINLDLMYGLPHQTVATIATTAKRALAFGPDRIALFGYAHVPWMKRHQKLIPEDALPNSTARFGQSRTAAEILVGAGYQQIGLDHFARGDDPLARRQREGRLHRNFQGYTTDETPNLVGFGPSAIGSLPDGFVQNAPSMVVYRDAIMTGRPATARGRVLSQEDRLRASIIERLMCDLRVDVAEVCKTHNARPDHFATELCQLDELVNDGIVERTGTKIHVPEQGRAFVRAVCATFDSYLSKNEMRFSRAS
jgi:oxygen-independent coproporphyrinogen-3 oxidase